MTDWAFYVATTDGGLLGELLAATTRKVTFRLDAPCDAQLTIDGRHPDASVIDELTTDIFAVWDNRTMTRLRTGASSDDIDESSHVTQFGAVDYRGLLERRYTFSTPLTYTDDDPAFIAWDLVDYTQNRVALDGGLLGNGITRGIHDVSFDPIDHVVPAGKQIAEGINDLSKLTFGIGFDWEVSGDLELNIWEERGTDREFVAEYGSNVSKVGAALDPSEYANAVRSSGADGVAAATRVAPDLASRPEGRIEAQVGNTDLTTTAAVAATGSTELARRGALTRSYKVTFKPGEWNPDLLWLGDTATYVVKSGRLDVVGRDRIVEISVEIGDDGSEVVEATFGTRRQDVITALRRLPGSLETLFRR